MRENILKSATRPLRPFTDHPKSCDRVGTTNAMQQRGVTKDEFLTDFGDVVEQVFDLTLTMDGMGTTMVDGRVVDATQEEEIACENAPDYTNFTSEILVEGTGSADTICTAELEIMGTTFLDTCPQGSDELCDPLYRIAVQVEASVVMEEV